ncbi:sodium/nucleoside cotransporter 2-like [Penaeus monodon]|uniref:sodium/nucleoside cotransporter 2-like n=1 Tax=Penaeus monodon TaxID=6687 RepID=UPI0018A70AFB|nr:sodium/nucleoside cotransporter 2-like [Penaeus monodon]
MLSLHVVLKKIYTSLVDPALDLIDAYYQSLFGWIFMPLAGVMGVDWAECEKGASDRHQVHRERVPSVPEALRNEEERRSRRPEIIATYALWGFSNLSSIGINLGGFSAMAPGRKADLAKAS